MDLKNLGIGAEPIGYVKANGDLDFMFDWNQSVHRYAVLVAKPETMSKNYLVTRFGVGDQRSYAKSQKPQLLSERECLVLMVPLGLVNEGEKQMLMYANEVPIKSSRFATDKELRIRTLDLDDIMESIAGPVHLSLPPTFFMQY